MGNELRHHSLLIQGVHTSRLAQSCDRNQSNGLCSNHDIAHRNLPRPFFPVCDTESDLHWGWLGLACETNLTERGRPHYHAAIMQTRQYPCCLGNIHILLLPPSLLFTLQFMLHITLLSLCVIVNTCID